MLIENQYLYNKSLMAAVVGIPNAGKSTLINHFLGFDLSMVTPKPQTTRNNFQCAFCIDHTEIVLVDTPGIHESAQEINKRMNEAATIGARGVDLNLILVDLSKEIIPQLKMMKDKFFKGETPSCTSWIIFTKSDLIENVSALPLDELFEVAKTLLPRIEKYFVVSSVKGTNTHLLTGALCDEATPGPHLYPNGEVSNKSERFFAAEYVRGQAFMLLKEELPYELAVVIDEFKDYRRQDEEAKPGPQVFIGATIYVNRPSQRAIVVGTGGGMIKQIGTNARHKIEEMVQGKVNLSLHVKVVPKWFKNNKILEELGLPRAQDSIRVWRKRDNAGPTLH